MQSSGSYMPAARELPMFGQMSPFQACFRACSLLQACYESRCSAGCIGQAGTRCIVTTSSPMLTRQMNIEAVMTVMKVANNQQCVHEQSHSASMR